MTGVTRSVGFLFILRSSLIRSQFDQNNKPNGITIEAISRTCIFEEISKKIFIPHEILHRWNCTRVQSVSIDTKKMMTFRIFTITTRNYGFLYNTTIFKLQLMAIKVVHEYAMRELFMKVVIC